MENKIKAILIDDESNGREVLRDLLENFFPQIDILGEADNVDNAFTLIEAKKPQLIFLDIQMPRKSGFALLKKYEEIPFEVIFVTSYDQYAINAIKFSALDYLLKPVEVKDLKIAINKASKSIETRRNNQVQIINLLHSLETDTKDRKITIHAGDNVTLISENNIAYIEANNRYCNIITHNGQNYITPKYLKEFEEYFGEQSTFVRIHKSCLLNISHIKKYSKGEPCIIEMVNGKTFEVSRRKKQEVLKKVKK